MTQEVKIAIQSEIECMSMPTLTKLLSNSVVCLHKVRELQECQIEQVLA